MNEMESSKRRVKILLGHPVICAECFWVAPDRETCQSLDGCNFMPRDPLMNDHNAPPMPE